MKLMIGFLIALSFLGCSISPKNSSENRQPASSIKPGFYRKGQMIVHQPNVTLKGSRNGHISSSPYDKFELTPGEVTVKFDRPSVVGEPIRSALDAWNEKDGMNLIIADRHHEFMFKIPRDLIDEDDEKIYVHPDSSGQPVNLHVDYEDFDGAQSRVVINLTDKADDSIAEIEVLIPTGQRP